MEDVSQLTSLVASDLPGSLIARNPVISYIVYILRSKRKPSQLPVKLIQCLAMWCGLFLKKSTQEGTWNRISGNFHRISRGIEERVCGNSKGQLNKEVEVEFPGCQRWLFRKNSCRISHGPCCWFLNLEFPKRCHIILQNFQGRGDESCLLCYLRVK